MSSKTFVIPSVGNEVSKIDVKSHQISITMNYTGFHLKIKLQC